MNNNDDSFPLIPPPPIYPVSQNLGGNQDPFSFESDVDSDSIELLPEKIEVRNLIVNDEDKNNPDYLCPVCKLFMIPDECMELKCGHLFCKNCLLSIGNNNLSLSLKCPLCNERSITNKYIKKDNKFAYKILCGVKIYCPNADCKEILLAGNLKDHLKKCEYELTDCKYCGEKNILKKDLKKHITDNMEVHFLSLLDEVETLKEKLNKRD